MEQDSITLSKLQAAVQAQGHQGGNIIREFDDGMSLTLQRPLQDVAGKLPKTSVRPLSPVVKAMCMSSAACCCKCQCRSHKQNATRSFADCTADLAAIC